MREIRIEAAQETVFQFFTDPEKMVRWIGIGATLDPRPGGVLYLNTVMGYSFAGEYLTVEPSSRIVFTWGYANFPDDRNPLPAGSSTVEINLVPDGEATIVRLSHRVPIGLADFHAMGIEELPRPARDRGHRRESGPDPFSKPDWTRERDARER